MAENVQINLNARNNAGPAIKQVQTELNGLGKAGNSASQGLSSLGGALAGGALFGAAIAGVQALGGAIVDMAAGAAKLETLRNSFDGLASGVGQSSAAMLDALRQTSAGMISDADLILSANKAMMLGVADSAEEMQALMQIAISRGAALGLSATQAFNDIVTGLGRGSALILDNLGIVIDAETVNEEYARSLGKSASALSEQEKKQALVNSVMREAASIAGNATDSLSANAVAIGSMGAAWQNLKDQLGTLVSPAVATAMQGLADALNAVNAGIQEVQATSAQRTEIFEADMLGGARTQLEQDLEKIKHAGLVGTDEWAAKVKELQGVYAELGLTFNSTTGQWEQALGGATAAFGEAEGAARGLAGAEADTGNAASEAAARSGDLASALTDTAAKTDAASAGTVNFSAELRIMAGIAASAAVDLDNLASAADDVMARMNAAIGGAQGLRTSAIGRIQSQALSLVNQGLLSGGDAREMILEANDALTNLNLSYEQTGEAALDNALAINALTGEYTGQLDAIEEADRAAKKLASEGMAAAEKAAKDAAAAVEKSFDKIRDKVSSVLQGGLDIGVGDEWEKALPREDAVNENARRLAAIAVEGLKGQDWLEEMRREVPDIMKVVEEAANPQAAAASILRDFQDGLVPDLLDKDRAKELVKRMITGEQTMAALAQEIAGELSQELGVALPQAQAAAFGALGVAPTEAGGTTGVGEGAAAELSSEATLKSMAKAGTEAALTWGTAFLDKVAEGVPASLIAMLTSLVTPQVQANLAAAQSQAAAQ